MCHCTYLKLSALSVFFKHKQILMSHESVRPNLSHGTSLYRKEINRNHRK